VIESIIFIVAALFFSVATVLAVLGITHVYMAGSEAIRRDGLGHGTRAPSWSLGTCGGDTIIHSPPARQFQLIIFTDHSLRSYPSVVDGLRMLSASESERLEVVVLLRAPSKIAKPVIRLLDGMATVPVVTGSPSLYAKYNVRVTPWIIVVDSAGRVRASSLVNHSWQVTKLWQIAQITTDPSKEGRRPRGMIPRLLTPGPTTGA
jgi:hypothetical protein